MRMRYLLRALPRKSRQHRSGARSASQWANRRCYVSVAADTHSQLFADCRLFPLVASRFRYRPQHVAETCRRLTYLECFARAQTHPRVTTNRSRTSAFGISRSIDRFAERPPNSYKGRDTFSNRLYFFFLFLTFDIPKMSF